MKYFAYTQKNYRHIPQLDRLTENELSEIDIVSRILPFKTNNYVVNELINWDEWETDPMFLLNFPQKNLLKPKHFDLMSTLVDAGEDDIVINQVADSIRVELNPHPAGQIEHNIPVVDGQKINGIQHKYQETMLIFPAQGQTCHAFCTFCFRWPQFTGMHKYKIALKHAHFATDYLREHPEITDVLITGGDPMIMNAGRLAEYVNALLDARIPHLKTIRIGTKSLSFWPYRYLTDTDSQDIIDLFKKIVDKGIHLSIMAHINHYREMSTPAFEAAVKKIQATGAVIRSQSPILNHINASSKTWKKIWTRQVQHGIIPYYMFVPRNTGAHTFFSVPLVKAHTIFTHAYSKVSGLARTVKGPVMSSFPGKIKIDGTPVINKEKTIAMSFTQGRSPRWVNRPFFASYDPDALWLDDLKPAFGAPLFFFEPFDDGEDLINKDDRDNTPLPDLTT